MKTVLLLSLLLLFLSLSVTAQRSNTRLKDSKTGDFQFETPETIKARLQQYLYNSQNDIVTSNFYKPLLIETDTMKNSYTYDASGNMLSVLEQVWSNGAWLNLWSSVYSYNLSGQLIMEVWASWANGNWQNNTRYSYSYDGLGRRLVNIQESWQNAVWENAFKFSVAYNNTGFLISDLTEQWTNGAWVGRSRNSYTPDNNNNIIYALNEEWVSGAWQNKVQYAYTWDVNDMLTAISQQWISGAWEDYIKLQKTYTLPGKLIMDTYQFSQGGVWSNYSRTTFTYDGNIIHVVLRTLENWTTTGWEYSTRYSYEYDNSGNQIVNLKEFWGGSWIGDYKYTYTFNSSGDMLSELYETYSGSSWINDENKTYTYDNEGNGVRGESFKWENGAWVYSADYLDVNFNHMEDGYSIVGKYYDAQYNMFTDVNDEDVELNSFRMEQNYPNPFNPSTVINYSIAKEGQVRLTVYNMLGAKVRTVVDESKPAGSYSVKVNAGELSSGVYLYRLESGNKSSAKKFILMK